MSERKMVEEDSVRTVDCLRGRLLAERAASRDAKAEAEHLQTRLIELEKLLKQEAKSRNRAEKKLKFLMKKLQSINILHVSDESEYSGFIDRTDISSISSTTSSIIKQHEGNENQQTQESKGEPNSEQIDSQNSSFSSSDEGTPVNIPDFEGLECETRPDKDATSPRISEQNEEPLYNQQSEKSSSKMDQQSEMWCGSNRCDGEWEGEVDDSMALVVVDTHPRVDPEALDATVKQLLNTLRIARDQLQASMLTQKTRNSYRIRAALASHFMCCNQ